jgi:very-short-patch-repair endonuclease
MKKKPAPESRWTRIINAGRETPALVGIVNRRKDWLILQREHWYRIPVRSAPESLSRIKYLAFYQTTAFEGEKCSVNYCAEVKDIRTVTRRELLPDEPGHRRAGEQYFRVALGDLQRLPHGIPSRRLRRLVFIPTSLERLRCATEINDLFRTSPIEDIMHETLKDAGLPAERQHLVRDADRSYLLDFALFCSDGNLNVECDGERYHSGPERAEQDRTRDNVLTADDWRILRFSGRELRDRPEECLKVIRRTIRRLGGIKLTLYTGYLRRRPGAAASEPKVKLR